jgi:NADH-quinone oxidoreductase subunit J
VSPVFFILALLTVLSAVAAISLRNLVHCALALTVAFGGLAALYLQLNAQFVGFAQVLVYIGAVAILIVFAILLTRGSEPTGASAVSSSWYVSGAVALGVFVVLAIVICSSKALAPDLVPPPQVSVRQIGDQLMTRYILPLEVLGLLLTAALIGAVIIAMREGPRTLRDSRELQSSAALSPAGNGQLEQTAWSRGDLPDGFALSVQVHSAAREQSTEEAGR